MAEKRLTTGDRKLKEVINDHAAAIDAIIADLATMKTKLNQAIVDTVALDTAIDTFVAKLNTDAGNIQLDDSDYAGAAAMTASAVGTLTAASLDGDTIG